MGTDWFVKVRCPYPGRDVDSEEGHIKQCSDCPYVIWEKPESVTGFMHTMCGVRVGSIGMAADLDDIGEKLSGVERFTKKESNPSLKKDILKQIKDYTEKNGGSINGLSKRETIEHLDTLIEFCKKQRRKVLIYGHGRRG
jgi:hypothetical protein